MFFYCDSGHAYQFESQETKSPLSLFPVPEDGQLTLDDLRSAFSSISSLRYTDENVSSQHHILCRDKIFIEPEGGWFKCGRVYLAVCDTAVASTSRFGLFESYRNQISTRNKMRIVPRKSGENKNADCMTTMITVGHGRFKNGAFTRMTFSSLSGNGGLAVVGPFSKTENTSKQIKEAAFEKFCQQNRKFKQKFKSVRQFNLVYPDGTLVSSLPNGEGEFSILAYRNFLDPQKRFDRLRLYLCEKQNYQNNQPIEIISCSSSSSNEDLPSLHSGEDIATAVKQDDDHHSSSSEADTLPLMVDVVFHYETGVLERTFPNNVKGSVLIAFVKEKLDVRNVELIITENNASIRNDDRLLEISTRPTLHVKVQAMNHREVNDDIGKDPIPATYQELETTIADKLVRTTLESLEGITEPTSIMKAFIKAFMLGRPLDVLDQASTLEGETSGLFVSRYDLFADAIQEVQYIENIRFPLEITFHGEGAQDYGGPRKEFLNILMKEIKERLMHVSESGDKTLVNNDEALARHHFYYAGLFIGLSALEGGPLADFLDEVISSPANSERKEQLIQGLRKTGIMQLMEKTNTVKYLFRPTASKQINATYILHLLKVSFSPEGSNRRIREENTYRLFIRYVRDTYAGRRAPLTLGSILAFITGSETEPLLGFTLDPSINFGDTCMLATASTCVNTLTLPLVGERSESDYFDSLDLAFSNQYFGLE